MRLFTGILTIVIGIAFTDPVPEAAASFKTPKSRISSGRKATISPSDVWVRIRSGMNISRPLALNSKGVGYRQDAGPQAAVRSRSSMVSLERRKIFKEKQGFSEFSSAAPLSISPDPESRESKFVPSHYTALGRKMLGKKVLSVGDIDCAPVSPRGYPGNLLPASQHAEGSVKSASRCTEYRQTALEGGDRQHMREAAKPAKRDYSAVLQGAEVAIEQRIDKFIAAYTRNPAFLFRVAERARPYLYHIVEELSRFRLPLEMALLPILESAYQPTAESPKSAKGLWQFIPGTGNDYDLTQSRDYDERLDIAKSTQAAIRFLGDLYRHFNGDWLLALAAYNAGQASVDNAVDRNRAKGLPSDFWSLNLPRETRDYVPRLLALSAIFSSPERYGINLPPVRNEPYFVKIEIDHELDVNYLAEKRMASVAGLAGLPPDQFRRLNPAYLGVTLSRRPFYNFLLPPANAIRFCRRLANLARFIPEPAGFRKTLISAEVPDASTDSSGWFGEEASAGFDRETKFTAPSLSFGAARKQNPVGKTSGL